MKKAYSTLLTLLAVVLVTPVSVRADTWGEPINTPDRFVVLSSFNNQAVFDKETGLVWEQSPSTLTLSWSEARGLCNKRVGNRVGWRLPTLEELASLVDPSQIDPALPAGHPFSNVQFSGYWSATTDLDASQAWFISLSDGGFAQIPKSFSSFFGWCVRGGQGVNPL